MSEGSNAIFLSYASQDAEAARRICDSLRATGLEVWFDQNELVGGDAWDQKIKRQIRECALFVPVISAATNARLEGYFRREWKLAVDRTHDMAEEKAFLMPVVIDATTDAAASVPEKFREVQWTRLSAGETTPAFVARVKQLLGPADAARLNRSQKDAREPAAPLSPRRPAFPWAFAALAVVVLGLLAFIALRPPAKEASAVPAPARPVAETKAAASASAPLDDKSVAVLAFANMSAEKDTEYFSDGISEEILDALAHNPALRVAARTSSFSFKGKNATAEEIGRALHVAHVIEGSVRRAGNQVRITVQLINAANGYHAWSETFTREMTDIFAVQSEIAAQVARKLSAGSATAALSATPVVAPTKNLAAYDAYLRGRAVQVAGSSPALSEEAARHYEEAVRLDPDYAVAWARLAQVYENIQSSRDPTEDGMKKVRAAAATALRLDPNLVEAHLAQALILQEVDYDFAGAQRELDQAERLRPNDAEVPAARAYLEFMRGNWGEQFSALVRLAEERDPQNADALNGMGHNLWAIGKFSEADRLFDRAWAGQKFPAPLRFKALMLVEWTGNVAAALALLETCPDRLRNGFFYDTLVELTALRGDPAATIAAGERWRDVTQRDPGSFLSRAMEVSAIYRIGWTHALSGHATQAEELFREALARAEKLTVDFPRSFFPSSQVALIQARRGQRIAALTAAAEAIQLADRAHDVWARQLSNETQAAVWAALGEVEDAVKGLRAMHEMGWAFGYKLRLYPEWVPLRGDAKFQQLMKEAEARADAQPRPKKL